MFSISISLLLSLCCCALAGTVMGVLRLFSAPLWLIFSFAILLVMFLFWSASRLYAGKGRYQEHQPALTPFKEYPLVVASLCFFCVALLRLPQFLADTMIMSLFLVAAPLLAAAACAVRFCFGEAHPFSAPLSLIPILFLCMNLVAFYRSNSKQPDVRVFGYEVILLSLLLLGLFMTSSSKYKRRHPVLQRLWAMLPLACVFMELFLLIVESKFLYRANDMGLATLLSITGACALLITPLYSPIQPVVFPKAPTDEESTAENSTAEDQPTEESAEKTTEEPSEEPEESSVAPEAN